MTGCKRLAVLALLALVLATLVSNSQLSRMRPFCASSSVIMTFRRVPTKGL